MVAAPASSADVWPLLYDSSIFLLIQLFVFQICCFCADMIKLFRVNDVANEDNLS